MKRYSQDYGLAMFAFRSPRRLARRPLTRQEAARVIAEPLPKRASGSRYATVGPLAASVAIVLCWAVAWVWAMISW